MDLGPDLFARRPDRRGGAGELDLTARLAAFVGDARAHEAAESRAREGFLRRAAAEEGTFAGVLVDLAERGTPVLLVGAGGRRLRGSLVAVGADFAALRTAEGREVLVAHRGVASVSTEPRSAVTAGDRALVLPVGLAEALAVLAEDRPRVLVVSTGAGHGGDAGLAGELLAVGRDVVTLRLDGADRRSAYVPLANLAEVALA